MGDGVEMRSEGTAEGESPLAAGVRRWMEEPWEQHWQWGAVEDDSAILASRGRGECVAPA